MEGEGGWTGWPVCIVIIIILEMNLGVIHQSVNLLLNDPAGLLLTSSQHQPQPAKLNINKFAIIFTTRRATAITD